MADAKEFQRYTIVKARESIEAEQEMENPRSGDSCGMREDLMLEMVESSLAQVVRKLCAPVNVLRALKMVLMSDYKDKYYVIVACLFPRH